MIRLNREVYDRVLGIAKGDYINIEIISVIKGINPGEIFVDDVNDPRAAIVWSKGIQGFYFIGDNNSRLFLESVKDFIDGTVACLLKQEGLKDFEFSGTSKEWSSTIEKVFKDRGLKKSKQLTYKHKNLKEYNLKKFEVEDVYSFQRVQEGCFEEISNPEFLREGILEYWNSIEEFLKYGVGYYFTKDNEVIASCITSCFTGDKMGSHIFTKEEHRRKGLSKALVQEFLRYCKEKDIEPNWDCMESNKGSRKTAEICGYELDYEYNLYWFEIK